MRIAILALILASLRTGPCGSPTAPLAQVPAGAQAVETETILSQPWSGIAESRSVVIRDADAWSRFWAEATANVDPAPEPPAIDFNASMVIAAAMGTRPSGGYAISIDEVRMGDEALFAVLREVSPGAGCVTIDALTAPVAAVRLERSDAPVTFVQRRETQAC